MAVNLNMKIGIVVASLGRAKILAEFLAMVKRQSRLPDHVVLSVVSAQDLPELGEYGFPVQVLFGSAGSCGQRHRGIDFLQQNTEIMLFLDDDFWMCPRYLETLSQISSDGGIACATGYVVADG